MKFLICLLLINYAYSSSLPCALRKYPDGYVCVCNNTYCDTINDVLPDNNNSVVVISTSRAGLRFKIVNGMFGTDSNSVTNNIIVTDHNRKKKLFYSSRAKSAVIINIDESQKYQQIQGFGGAFTGSVSYLFDNIDKQLKDLIYKSYYSLTEGIGYNMMRIPIGGCDFDLGPWAYNELPINDTNLSNFTQLDQRDILKVKQIKDLKEITNNYDIKFMGAAWSAPPWMKTNNDWTGASALKKEYYQTWANYHLKYLELMSKENMTYWGISTGNEPLNGVIGFLFVHFMSMGWTAASQGIWVGDNLGPVLKNSNFNNVKIFAGDDQRYTFPLWFTNMENNHNKSMEYVDGLAVHWYWDAIIPPSVLDQAHENFPNKIILSTESCYGDKPWSEHKPLLGSWDRAEEYAKYISQNLEHWVGGWIDWNLILNEQGGPNYVSNFVDAPVIVNTTSKNEAYKQPMFYVLGHFSKYILPGSVRIYTESTDLQTIAFLRPDNNIAVIIFNNNDRPYDILLKDRTRGEVLVSIPERSIHTILYK